jgi:hypothetical protein
LRFLSALPKTAKQLDDDFCLFKQHFTAQRPENKILTAPSLSIPTRLIAITRTAQPIRLIVDTLFSGHMLCFSNKVGLFLPMHGTSAAYITLSALSKRLINSSK